MKYLLTTFLLLFVLITPVLADTVVRTGDQVSVSDDQSIIGNFYAIGNAVTVSGESTEDLTLIGGKVRANGVVVGDVLAFGITAGIDGDVSGDVRILAGDVTVAGAIAGDLVVVGGSVEVLSSASIAGDVLVYGGSLLLNGPVQGDVLGRMERLTINTSVEGSVDVGVVDFTLGNDAAVGGTVRYASNNLVSQAFNASVVGETLRNDPVSVADTAGLISLLTIFLVILLASFVWYFLSRTTLSRVTEQTLRHLPRSAITGVVTFFATPLIITVLVFSYLGTFVAAILLFGYITLLLLACAALPAMVGQLVMRVFNQPYAKLTPLAMVVGAIVCSTVLLFPMIGVFVLLFLVVIALGGLTESVIKAGR
jgi:hypothetical protein